MQNIPKINGLVAATFTPMNEDGTVNFAQIEPMVEHLAANNIEHIYVCGSTGEGPSLTFEERIKLAEAFRKNSQGRLKIIVNVGHNSIWEAKKLAEHAQKIGAYAISAAAPSYYSILSAEALVASMADIASAAPKLPFYYYHIPALTGSYMSMVDFLKIGSENIPNLAGIKYTATTLHEFSSCLAYENGKYDILYGLDEMLLGAMAFGAKGFIGSTYNFASFIYQEVLTGFRDGNLDKAKQHQEFAGKVVDIIIRNNGLPAQKAMMKIIGLDCGPVRLPLQNLETSTIESIRKELEEIGLFDALQKHGEMGRPSPTRQIKS